MILLWKHFGSFLRGIPGKLLKAKVSKKMGLLEQPVINKPGMEANQDQKNRGRTRMIFYFFFSSQPLQFSAGAACFFRLGPPFSDAPI